MLQIFVYSEDTVNFKQSVAAVEYTDLRRILTLAENIRGYLVRLSSGKIIEYQMRGISIDSVDELWLYTFNDGGNNIALPPIRLQ